MNFSIDKQTLDDLGIFNKKGHDSVFGLFNRCRTRGGAEIMEQMFRYPLSDAGTINHRSRVIRFFQSSEIVFPFKEEWFDLIEQYLSNVDERSKLSQDESKLSRAWSGLIGTDIDYKQIVKAVSAIVSFLNALQQFLTETQIRDGGVPYQSEAAEIRLLLNDTEIKQLLIGTAKQRQDYEQIAVHDKLLRFTKKALLQKLLYYTYNLDVYITVAKVAAEHSFVFPEALSAGHQTLMLVDVYHPLLKNAKANTLKVAPDRNVIFLTGANMAGKSTFMKSLGISVFLAHMGFPVPASRMEFPVMDGLFSTINLPDNLSMGYSHFYAEVLRVKKVAEQLALSKRIFVIFDELFRGTNVKDAYEATVALTVAFAKKRNSMFVISTHIIEAGEELKKQCDNIWFTYLPTLMDGLKPVYTYKLEEGITSDRHGMIIISNEGIIDILKQKKIRKKVSKDVIYNR